MVAQCRRYGVSVWSCPQFLFLIMGVFIIVSVLTTYVIAQRFITPEIVLLIVFFLTGFLFIITYIIVKAFEKLVETRMREAEQAKELLRLKDQFVFIAAHELRTPATAIKWNLELLGSGDNSKQLSSQGQQILGRLQQSNERLLTLVQDILGVARIEGKTIKVALSPVSPKEVAQSSIQETESEAHKMDVKITEDISASLPRVAADPVRFKEVFINLLTNGIKFNKRGGSVTLSAKQDDNSVVVSVSDTGMGFSEEDKKHAFEKFWRAEDVKAKGVEGTGLGLFIIKNLLDLMNGEIWFESELGKGTTFYIRLPVYEDLKRPVAQ